VSRALALLLLAAAWGGCCTYALRNARPQRAYEAAIRDAAVASPAEIHPLRPLPPGPSVSMVAWVSERSAPCPAGATPCTLTVGENRLWATVAGEVQARCRSWKLLGAPLRRRLEQLLGLPPDPPPLYRKVLFALLEVPRERVERPCLGVDETDPSHPSCTLYAQGATSADLLGFVGQQMAGSYVLDGPQPGYPYTRLGYTYDWHPAAGATGHYGASELVVMPGTAVIVTAQIATDDYCRVTAASPSGR
jgi:hypothetical protein